MARKKSRKRKGARKGGLQALFSRLRNGKRRKARKSTRKTHKTAARRTGRKRNAHRRVTKRRVVRRRARRMNPGRKIRRRTRKTVARKTPRRTKHHQRRANGRKRTYSRRYTRRHRRSNPRKASGGLLKTLKAMLPQILGGAGAFVAARFLGNYVESKKTIVKPGVSGILGSAAVMAAGWAAGKYLPKQVSTQMRNALMLGAGIDVAMRLGGMLLPADSAMGQFLRGEQPVALPSAAPTAMKGIGQYDMYESGLLGTGAYVSDPSEYGDGAIGAYVPDNGMAGYLEPPKAGPMHNVQIAPAGVGATVYEAPAGFAGGANFNGGTLPDLSQNLEDASLDPAEAGAEGLVNVHAQISAQNGYLLYATPDTASDISKSGFIVKMVKNNSTQYPGVPLIAAIPAGSLQVSGGVMQPVQGGTVPLLESQNMGAGFNRSPMPVDETRPNSGGGIFESQW